MPHPYFALPRPHLFAHRGASGAAPENTLQAFDLALAMGVSYLEMDCHATRDGEIVVCHDADVGRTTEGAGEIRDIDWADLARFDAGHRFTPDGGASFPFRGRGCRIPRLAEVLERYPRAHLNIEVKQGQPAIAAQVIGLLRQQRATERVLLAAEYPEILDEIRALQPGTALGSSRDDVIAFYQALDAGNLARFTPAGHALQIPTEVFGRQLITPESLAGARRVGLFVHVWTIDEPREIQALLAAGVDGVMSNHPDRLLKVAAQSR